MAARDRVGIAIPIAVLVVVIILTVGVHRPRWRQLMSLVTDVAHAEQVLEDAIAHQDDFEAAQGFLPRQMEKQGAADQRFLSEVSAEIARLGLYLLRLEPKDHERVSEHYFRGTYTVELEGQYETIIEFLDYLEKLPEVVVVKSIDMRSTKVVAGNGHRTHMTFTVTGY